jgi:hypothetical protein
VTEATYWNGEPCEARQVTVVVADSGAFPFYWAREYVGQRRDAVEVVYADSTFYLDDDEHDDRPKGDGWWKVTEGHGSPRCGHRSLQIEPGTVEAREAMAA